MQHLLLPLPDLAAFFVGEPHFPLGDLLLNTQSKRLDEIGEVHGLE
jgi:hypothetical protein